MHYFFERGANSLHIHEQTYLTRHLRNTCTNMCVSVSVLSCSLIYYSHKHSQSLNSHVVYILCTSKRLIIQMQSLSNDREKNTSRILTICHSKDLCYRFFRGICNFFLFSSALQWNVRVMCDWYNSTRNPLLIVMRWKKYASHEYLKGQRFGRNFFLIRSFESLNFTCWNLTFDSNYKMGEYKTHWHCCQQSNAIHVVERCVLFCFFHGLIIIVCVLQFYFCCSFSWPISISIFSMCGKHLLNHCYYRNRSKMHCG